MGCDNSTLRRNAAAAGNGETTGTSQHHHRRMVMMTTTTATTGDNIVRTSLQTPQRSAAATQRVDNSGTGGAIRTTRTSASASTSTAATVAAVAVADRRRSSSSSSSASASASSYLAADYASYAFHTGLRCRYPPPEWVIPSRSDESQSHHDQDQQQAAGQTDKIISNSTNSIAVGDADNCNGNGNNNNNHNHLAFGRPSSDNNQQQNQRNLQNQQQQQHLDFLFPIGKRGVYDPKKDPMDVNFSANAAASNRHGNKNKKGLPNGGLKPNRYFHPTGLTTLPDGNVIVCDTGNSRIQILCPYSRTVVRTIERRPGNVQFKGEREKEEISRPVATTVLPCGKEIVVVDTGHNRLQVIDIKTGAFKRNICGNGKGSGSDQMVIPTGIAVLPFQPAFLKKKGNGNNKKAAAAAPTSAADSAASRAAAESSGGGGSSTAAARAAAESGGNGGTEERSGYRIVVCDSGNNRLQVIDPYTGEFIETLVDEFNHPSDVIVLTTEWAERQQRVTYELEKLRENFERSKMFLHERETGASGSFSGSSGNMMIQNMNRGVNSSSSNSYSSKNNNNPKNKMDYIRYRRECKRLKKEAQFVYLVVTDSGNHRICLCKYVPNQGGKTMTAVSLRRLIGVASSHGRNNPFAPTLTAGGGGAAAAAAPAAAAANNNQQQQPQQQMNFNMATNDQYNQMQQQQQGQGQQQPAAGAAAATTNDNNSAAAAAQAVADAADAAAAQANAIAAAALAQTQQSQQASSALVFLDNAHGQDDDGRVGSSDDSDDDSDDGDDYDGERKKRKAKSKRKPAAPVQWPPISNAARMEYIAQHTLIRRVTTGGRGIGKGQMCYPCRLAELPNGCVIVTDIRNHRLQMFDPFGFGNGNNTGDWGTGTSGAGAGGHHPFGGGGGVDNDSNSNSNNNNNNENQWYNEGHEWNGEGIPFIAEIASNGVGNSTDQLNIPVGVTVIPAMRPFVPYRSHFFGGLDHYYSCSSSDHSLPADAYYDAYGGGCDLIETGGGGSGLVEASPFASAASFSAASASPAIAAGGGSGSSSVFMSASSFALTNNNHSSSFGRGASSSFLLDTNHSTTPSTCVFTTPHKQQQQQQQPSRAVGQSRSRSPALAGASGSFSRSSPATTMTPPLVPIPVAMTEDRAVIESQPRPTLLSLEGIDGAAAAAGSSAANSPGASCFGSLGTGGNNRNRPTAAARRGGAAAAAPQQQQDKKKKGKLSMLCHEIAETRNFFVYRSQGLQGDGLTPTKAAREAAEAAERKRVMEHRRRRCEDGRRLSLSLQHGAGEDVGGQDGGSGNNRRSSSLSGFGDIGDGYGGGSGVMVDEDVPLCPEDPCAALVEALGEAEQLREAVLASERAQAKAQKKLNKKLSKQVGKQSRSGSSSAISMVGSAGGYSGGVTAMETALMGIMERVDLAHPANRKALFYAQVQTLIGGAGVLEGYRLVVTDYQNNRLQVLDDPLRRYCPTWLPLPLIRNVLVEIAMPDPNVVPVSIITEYVAPYLSPFAAVCNSSSNNKRRHSDRQIASSYREAMCTYLPMAVSNRIQQIFTLEEMSLSYCDRDQQHQHQHQHFSTSSSSQQQQQHSSPPNYNSITRSPPVSGRATTRCATAMPSPLPTLRGQGGAERSVCYSEQQALQPIFITTTTDVSGGNGEDDGSGGRDVGGPPSSLLCTSRPTTTTTGQTPDNDKLRSCSTGTSRGLFLLPHEEEGGGGATTPTDTAKATRKSVNNDPFVLSNSEVPVPAAAVSTSSTSPNQNQLVRLVPSYALADDDDDDDQRSVFDEHAPIPSASINKASPMVPTYSSNSYFTQNMQQNAGFGSSTPAVAGAAAPSPPPESPVAQHPYNSNAYRTSTPLALLAPVTTSSSSFSSSSTASALSTPLSHCVSSSASSTATPASFATARSLTNTPGGAHSSLMSTPTQVPLPAAAAAAAGGPSRPSPYTLPLGTSPGNSPIQQGLTTTLAVPVVPSGSGSGTVGGYTLLSIPPPPQQHNHSQQSQSVSSFGAVVPATSSSGAAADYRGGGLPHQPLIMRPFVATSTSGSDSVSVVAATTAAVAAGTSSLRPLTPLATSATPTAASFGGGSAGGGERGRSTSAASAMTCTQYTNTNLYSCKTYRSTDPFALSGSCDIGGVMTMTSAAASVIDSSSAAPVAAVDTVASYNNNRPLNATTSGSNYHVINENGQQWAVTPKNQNRRGHSCSHERDEF